MASDWLPPTAISGSAAGAETAKAHSAVAAASRELEKI